MAELKYVGNGRYIAGIPARDLEDSEIEGRGINRESLLSSGLYEQRDDKPSRASRGSKGDSHLESQTREIDEQA